MEPMSTKSENASKRELRRIREAGSTAAVTHFVNTRWPVIGGRELKVLPTCAFLDPEFAEAYQPGQIAYVYVAGSGDTLKAPEQPTGLHGLARRLALPLFKISATGSENALSRIEDINVERYAGMYEAESGHACDPGYDLWRLVLIHAGRKALPGAPIEARPRVLRVALPSGLSVIAFEKELHQRLSSTALRRWIASSDGLRHCGDLGVDPREGMRLTGYNVGEVDRVSRADEIYIVKPRLDGWRLLTLVERIVYDFVIRDAVNDRPSWGWISVNQGFKRAGRKITAELQAK